LRKIIQDGGINRFNRVLFKKSTLTKPPIIWETKFSPRISDIPSAFVKDFKVTEIPKMAFGDFFNENYCFLVWLVNFYCWAYEKYFSVFLNTLTLSCHVKFWLKTSFCEYSATMNAMNGRFWSIKTYFWGFWNTLTWGFWIQIFFIFAQNKLFAFFPEPQQILIPILVCMIELTDQFLMLIN
jgi:hypothetical protein